ncbi:MAG TPA: amino acid ABC transporter permease [Desulfobulbus sp.]|nr:amino acid ABC transporter permease [Desulfobulbus sp.]
MHRRPGKNIASSFDVIKYLLTLGGLAWLIGRGSEQLGYSWHWHRIPGYILTVSHGHWQAGPLLEGLMVTLEVSAASLVLAALIGLVTALLRLSGSLVGRVLAVIYLETIRNTPLLVQIFFLYFVMAPILDLSRFTAAVLALAFFEGAYASEIFRAGIVSVARGQWEAAYSLGLSNYATYRHIILPQAVRLVLPPLTSQAISLVKDSALVSTIAVYDLTMQGRAIVAETFLVFEVWFTLAAIYLLLAFMLSLLVRLVERLLAGRGQPAWSVQ